MSFLNQMKVNCEDYFEQGTSFVLQYFLKRYVIVSLVASIVTSNGMLVVLTVHHPGVKLILEDRLTLRNIMGKINGDFV